MGKSARFQESIIVKNILRIAYIFVTLAVAAAAVGGQAKSDSAAVRKLKPQTLCPVMKNPIDSSAYTDIQGQRVYHCCKGCEKKLRANPDIYFEEAAAQGVLFENIQKACPVTGKPIDKKFLMDYKGRRVYFCSNVCAAAFAKDPKKYLQILDNQTAGKR
jgi:YHS domain-containing protein